MKGDWEGIYDAQIGSLKTERDIALTTKAISDETRNLIKDYYDLKIEEAEAYKNFDVLKLAQIGLREFSTETNKTVGDTFKNVLPDGIRAFGTEFKKSLKTGKLDFKSFGTDLIDIWDNVCQKLVESWITKFINQLVSPSTAAEGAGGGSWLSALPLIGGLFKTPTVPTVSGLPATTPGLMEWLAPIEAQEGGTFWARGPTPFIAGEIEPELVSVTPKSEMVAGMGGRGNTIIMYIEATDVNSFEKKYGGSVTKIIHMNKKSGMMRE